MSIFQVSIMHPQMSTAKHLFIINQQYLYLLIVKYLHLYLGNNVLKKLYQCTAIFSHIFIIYSINKTFSFSLFHFLRYFPLNIYNVDLWQIS